MRESTGQRSVSFPKFARMRGEVERKAREELCPASAPREGAGALG